MIIGFKNHFFFFLLTYLLLSSVISYGQKTTDQFIIYLNNSNQNKHLVDYVEYLKHEKGSISDTNQFRLGKSYYKLQNLSQSTDALKQLNNSSIYFSESRFLMHINAIYLHDYNSGFNYLNQLKTTDTLINDLKNYQLSGLALLNRDLELYIEYDSKINNEYYFYSEERDNLQRIADNLRSRKLKSPWVAGMLTAIVPGSGKFYAGKRGQGVYSFVISMFLALQTWESFNKDGLNSTRFIAYGSLLSLFHAGNIWSSALSVKNYNNEFNEAADYRIKMDLHIPIRTFFN
jgi:hypothetical protein